MDLTPKVPADRQVLEAYGDRGFRVSGRRFEGSLLVFPREVLPWPVSTMDELSPESLGPMIERAGEVEIMLLGAGAAMAFVPAALRQHLKDHGIAVDVMDTGAACRTYNVLMAEDRRVAAALIAVD
ncbi:MAG: hypothetical protein TEF_10745 [Rhizobiales bacterium NRL2]|jgi:uncharacterized protein|nr:MAG: hypothetical protein TEF_10745 [Rhizobiales bacterium NRL2]